MPCNYTIQSEIDKGKCRSRGIRHLFPLNYGDMKFEVHLQKLTIYIFPWTMASGNVTYLQLGEQIFISPLCNSLGKPCQRTIEILSSGVGDFPILYSLQC